MKKFIYKITNLINGKCYIGQTNNPRRREREHFSIKNININQENKILYYAMAKYGLENFIFEIIEDAVINYNEREIFWIKHYNSIIPNGYNMTPGGENPPTLRKEGHPFCNHNMETIKQIYLLLKNSKLSIAEIAKKTNYNVSSINRINLGQLWYNEELTYPIRFENTIQYKQERMENIVYDLLYTNLTQKEIAQKYSISRTTVTAINNGQNFRKDNQVYPLRNFNCQKKPILMIDKNSLEVIQEFSSSSEAEKILSLPKRASSNIRYCAQGKIKTAYGYIWKYKN